MVEQVAAEVPENTDVTDEQMQEVFGYRPKEDVDEKQEEAPKAEGAQEEKPEEKQEEKPADPAENYKKAMYEERMRRKEAQQQAKQFQQQLKQMQEQLEALKKPRSVPDINEAPLDNVDARLRRLEEQRQYAEQQHREQVKAQEAESARKQALQEYYDAAQEYKEVTPDFDDAYKYFAEGRIAEFVALGHSQEEAVRIAIDDEIEFASRLLSMGKNPAEVIYKFAESRGYKKPQKKTSNLQIAEEKINMLEKGVKSSKVASGQPTSKGELTLEALAEMDEDEFLKNWDKLMK